MDHLGGQNGRFKAPEVNLNNILPPHQPHWNSVFGGSLNSAIDLDCGRLIAAHRIDCDFDFGHEELFLSGLDNFPLLVVAAVRTGPMRHAQLVAIGAFREGSRRQMIVRPPAVAPRLRVSSFWIWHTLTPASGNVKIHPLPLAEGSVRVSGLGKSCTLTRFAPPSPKRRGRRAFMSFAVPAAA